MGARLRSWWQKIRKPLAIVGIIVVCALGITLIVGIIGGYPFNWGWTGLNGHNNISTATEITSSPPKITKTLAYQPGKTLWDWLQLLIIPLVLAIAALLFNLATTRTEQKIAAQRYEQDRHIALDKQREGLLQTYLDRMSELLLKEKLRSSAVDAEVRNVARVRTATILFQLDARRIGYVFAFLRESRLMSTKPNDSIVSLNQTNLSKINLSQATLYKADLRGAILRGAILILADLSEADLSEATLYKADLRRAILSRADLYKADLSEANLGEANLSEANLSEANLSYAKLLGADLSIANLGGANLSDANLSGDDLSGAILNGAYLIDANLSEADLAIADLSRADLRGAIVTSEQLETARSLQGATMPDGSKHS